MKWAKQDQSGFTIVELLIVVVVIAILAAITIVSYNGISQRALESTLQNEVSSALKALETAKIGSDTSSYPATLSSVGLGNSTTVSYYHDAVKNTFCVESKKGEKAFSATSEEKTIMSGPCSENGLLGWWRFNGDAADSSTKGFNGTASNTTNTTGQNGVSSNAFAFSSGTSSSVSVPHNSTLSSDPQTFSLWVRPTSWASANASALISKRNTSSNGYYIAYITSSLRLVFDCGSSISPNRWVTNYVPPLNNWTHLVFTCSSSSGVALYVNGALEESRPTVSRTAMASSTADLRFGRDASALQHYWNGSIDDIRIYSRAINSAEAQALFNVGAQ